MSITSKVPVIGLVGGVCSGKSSVARWIVSRQPVAVIDADVLGHQVLSGAQIKTKIRERFGDSVFDESGQINRGRLADRVFGRSGDHHRARKDLESLVHPEIWRLIQDQICHACEAGDVKAVILDAAVLIEAGWQDACEFTVFVDAPDCERLRRATEHRGWTEKEFKKREASQLPIQEKISRADYVIANDAADVCRAGRQFERILTRHFSTGAETDSAS